MGEARNIVAAYFLLQAVAVGAWWMLLNLYPPAARWFVPSSFPTDSLTNFWLADSLMLIGGSLVTAQAVRRQVAWATTAVWSVAMVSCYPTFWCLAASLRTNAGWIATALMAMMTMVSLSMASIHGNGRQHPRAIRVVRMARRSALAYTLVQVAIFWSLFLWILPKGVDEFARFAGLRSFYHQGQTACATTLFALASALGIWSALSIVVHGHGTPLPTATAPRLVLAGPYRRVRNPMAVAGILQGVAVGWYFGSIAVIGYAVCGALIWHFVARPIEERDLVRRFGALYLAYREDVPLWVPLRWHTLPDVTLLCHTQLRYCLPRFPRKRTANTQAAITP